MERSALYRRALAPIVLFAGIIGILAAAAGLLFRLETPLSFSALWMGAAIVAIAGAFFIVRRQALKAGEPFWSPPTRRVAQTLLPPLTAGMVWGVLISLCDFTTVLPFLWAVFYGCALHSAGFFMSRSVRWFGWLYIILSTSILCFFIFINPANNISAHWFMGFFFGVLHLAYAAYLYLTEKGKNAA